MATDAPATAVGGSTRDFLGEAEWRVLMADYERWDGTQASFCKARGVSLKTFQGWRRKFGLTARAAASDWDVELSLGGGVVLRLRRS